MKKIFSKIWNWFDGKKTKIGGVISGCLLTVDGVFPDLMSDNLLKGLLILSGALFGTGVVHKGIKTETGQKTLKSIQNAAKKVTPKRCRKSN